MSEIPPGPLEAAVLADVEQFGSDEPYLASLGALAVSLAHDQDVSPTAANGKVLREVLTKLNETAPPKDDGFSDWLAEMSKPSRPFTAEELQARSVPAPVELDES